MSVKNYRKLYLNTKKSDVTLVIDDRELPAHRFILSERSEYFKTMFSSSFIETNSDKITLQETNLKAFKSVLKYIYTGTIEHLYNVKIYSDEFFEVLARAQYYMVTKLLLDTISCIKRNAHVDACLLLNKAIAYTVDDLIGYTTFMIRKGKSCFITQTFKLMSPKALEYFLKLRLDEHESTIFKALVYWMQNNLEHSALFPNFLELVDLYVLKEKHLDMLFEPIQLIDRSFYENLLKEQQEKAKKVQKVVNQNVISGIDDLRILDGNRKWQNTIFETNRKTIIVDLKQHYLLNCIKLTVNSSGHFDASYVVDVSNNIHHWKRVIDHSTYQCFRPQVLYFEECVFRFFRIKFMTQHDSIDTNIEALYSTDLPEIDPETTLIVPNQNI
uniref:BTB domain-containing protein n=1 Tax=Panagrellus redivivus TaxID=6233 RepID=A0A7E4W2T1_PANRE